jgi:hypothetical protein
MVPLPLALPAAAEVRRADARRRAMLMNLNMVEVVLLKKGCGVVLEDGIVMVDDGGMLSTFIHLQYLRGY